MTKKETKFDKFNKYVNEGIKLFNLSDWSIYTRFPKEDDVPLIDDSMAIVYCDRQACQATIVYNNKKEDELKTDRDIKEIAYHELLHIVIAPYDVLARERFNVSLESIAYEEHRIINKLLNVIL